MTHYALRIDYPNLNLIKQYFKNYTNVWIGPIEYKKTSKTPHIHMAFDYEKLSKRQETDILRTPMIEASVIVSGKYSLKEVEITEEYPEIEQAYLYYLTYCCKGNAPCYSNLPQNVLESIPIWIDNKQHKESFRDYVIESYKVIEPISAYYRVDMFGEEKFDFASFRDIEINNIYKHLQKVFKNKRQLFDLGIWRKYLNLILLEYYQEYYELKQPDYIDAMLKIM